MDSRSSSPSPSIRDVILGELDDGVEICDRIESFCEEIKVMIGQINIINDRVKDEFGIQLTTNSELFKDIDKDAEEIKEIKDKLRLVRNQKVEVQENYNLTYPPECQILDWEWEKSIEDMDRDPLGTNEFTIKIYKPLDRSPLGLLRTQSRGSPSPTPSEMQSRRVNWVIESDSTTTTTTTSSGSSDDRVPTPTTGLGCEFCGKRFQTRGRLAVHRLIHRANEEVEIKYVFCEFCEKRFDDQAQLQQHYLVHVITLPKPKTHECTYCDKAFSNKAILRRHVLVHTGEKPHKCSHCPMTFPRAENLRKHMERVNYAGEDRPFICEFCEEKFALPRYLLCHSRTHKTTNIAPLGRNVPVHSVEDGYLPSSEASSDD